MLAAPGMVTEAFMAARRAPESESRVSAVGTPEADEEFVALVALPALSARVALVGDAGAVALAQFAADVQAQAAGAAFGREKGFEQVALHRRLHGRAVAPDHQPYRAVPHRQRLHLDGAGAARRVA